ncbi:MAG: tetratricopeptide repeat protein, partial [Planctomycetota bacterium]
RKHLAAAESAAHADQHLHTSATVAMMAGEPAVALDFHHQLAERRPRVVGHHADVADRIGEVDGPDAAIDYVGQVSQRFPHHVQLQELHFHWLRDHDIARAEQVLREILQLDPDNAWAWRELAIFLRHVKPEQVPESPTEHELEEIKQAVETSGRLQPRHSMQALLETEQAIEAGDIDTAEKLLRAALDNNPDSGHLVNRLLGIRHETERVHANARFIADVLSTAPNVGEAVHTFYHGARETIDPPTLLTLVQQIADARPESYNVRVSLTFALLDADKREDAKASAEALVAFAPLLAGAWLTAARVHELSLDPDKQRAALERAIELNPRSDLAALELAELHSDAARFGEARAVINAALERMPRSVGLLRRRSELLFVASDDPDDQRAAVDALEEVIRLEPHIPENWGKYAFYCRHTEQGPRVRAFAEELLEQRPGDAELRLNLAQHLTNEGELNLALEHLDTLLAAAPRSIDAHDLRAELLGALSRFDDAQAACRPTVFGDDIPVSLQGRAALLLAQSGKIKAGLEKLQDVVAAAPKYIWGWQRIADLALEVDDFPLHADAIDRVLALNPNSPGALLAAARVRLNAPTGFRDTNKNERHTEARQLLEHAFALDPTETGVSVTLFRLLIEQNELDAAAQLLDRIEPHLFPVYAHRYQLELLLKSNQPDKAVLDEVHVRLRSIAVEQFPDGAPVGEALGSISEWLQTHPRRRRKVVRIVTELAHDHALNPPAAEPIAAWLVNHGESRKAIRRLNTLGANDPTWYFGAIGFLTHASEKTPPLAAGFAKRNEARIRLATGPQADEVWALAGHALLVGNEQRRAFALLQTHEQRGSVPDFALVNLAATAARNERWDIVAHAAAKGLEQPTHNFNPLALWHAYCLVRNATAADPSQPGIDEAAHTLEQVHREKEAAFYQMLYHVTNSLITFARADTPAAGYTAAKQHLDRATFANADYVTNASAKRIIHHTRVNLAGSAGIIAKLTARLANLIDFRIG